jgi:phenylalanine-4-hydroxylase
MARLQYSPVVTDAAGRARVQLGSDHPGVTDVAYRTRRDELAALATAWRPGQPVPSPRYTDAEQEIWRTVSTALTDLHERYAAKDFLEGKQALHLSGDRIPQLAEITALLKPAAAFCYQPVAGLAPLQEFYGAFADGVFWSTQYLRHPSAPLYTPEPDLLHEVIGHANQLAHPTFAELYRLFGHAVKRASGDASLRCLSRVFWYTMEFGVVWDGSELRAFGAGILSSVGEVQSFRAADVRPADLDTMGRGIYDISHYQPVLYSWRSLPEMRDRLSEFLEHFDRG